MNRGELNRLILLLKALRDAIANAGNATVEAISEDTRAHQQANEPKPALPLERIGIEVNFLEKDVHRYYSDQDNSYRLQRRTFWATVLTVLVIIAYTCVNYRQWRTMERQLEATDRPWIQVQFGQATKPEAFSVAGATPDTPLTIDQNGQGVIVFSFNLTNVGKSVANRVDFVYKTASTADAYVAKVAEEQKRLCDKPAQPVQNSALFPNQPISENAFGTFQTKDIPASSSKSKTVHLFVFGCVNYSNYPSAATIHQTGFIYEVFPGEPHAEIHRLITAPMAGTPVRQLSFELQEMYAR
jgi:hypothetical protein